VEELAGGQKIEERALPVIGGRPFFLYSGETPPGDAQGDELFNATFDQLDARYQEDRSGPIGVCVPISDPELMRRRPEAIWPETKLVFAGVQDGAAALGEASPVPTQLRIRYFYDATVGPGLPGSPSIAQSEAQDYSLPPGYRMEPLAETDAAGADEVLAFWESERAMPAPEEARRRVHEVLMVALDPDDRLAAVSTVYLQRNRQLGMDLWYYRTFVGHEHRLSHLAVRLLWESRDRLSERFVSGQDARGAGMITETESELLKGHYNRAFWVISDFDFIGETPSGAHVRVHYFPGARVPSPQ
jgi:hypothetical protein